MNYEPKIQPAIDSIAEVIANPPVDLDEIAFDDAAEFIETAEPDEIQRLVLFCAQVQSGGAPITAISQWCSAHREGLSQDYAEAFGRGILELVRLGAETAERRRSFGAIGE